VNLEARHRNIEPLNSMNTPSSKKTARLPPEVNRIVYVKNLPFKTSSQELYDLFGRYGAIRQIRVGNKPETKGRAFVVYEDIHEAKQAVEHLSGFNVKERYITVTYHRHEKLNPAGGKTDTQKRKDQIEQLKARYGVDERER